MTQEQIQIPNRLLKSATVQQRNRTSSYLKNTQQEQISGIDVNFKIPKHHSAIGGQRYKFKKVPQALKSTLKRQAVKMSQIKRNSSIAGLFQQMKQDVLNNIMDVNRCQLCEQVVNEQMFSLSNCDHMFCVNCLNMYITYKINVHELIICPEQKCNSPMNEEGQIFKTLPPSLISKYNRQKLWRQNQDNPNIRICPRQDCETGLIDMLLTPPKCKSCNRTFCRQCQLEAHEGKCQIAFENMFKDWKRCAKCRMFIEKNEGCNHMTCKCGFQFCYICESKWDNRHYQCGEFGAFQTPNCWCRILYISILILALPLIILMELLLVILIIVVGTILGFIFFPIFLCIERHLRQNYCVWLICCFPCILLLGMIVGPIVGFYLLFLLHSFLFQRYSRLCCP